jgi:hypothetical protein
MSAQRVSAYAAERDVRLARSAGRAPALIEALASGRLGVPHAHRLSQQLEDIADPEAAQVAVLVCADDRLPVWSVGEVGRAAAKVAAELNPAAFAERRRRKQKEADVYVEPGADAMSWLTLYGPAEDVTSAFSAISARARAARRAEDRAGEERTPMGLLRFQAAVRLLLSRGPLGWQGASTGRDAAPGGADSPYPAVVTRVTVPFSTLAGVDDAPGELAGSGPIPAHIARALAAQSQVWWRLLTDPVTGALCPTESTAYRIPEPVRRWVLARDRSCSHPGCDRPADYCDLDHALEWPAGPTCPCNLTPRCRRHHNAKTHHRWQIRARLDGSHVTVSPTGRVYPTAADPPPGPIRGLTPSIDVDGAAAWLADVEMPVGPGDDDPMLHVPDPDANADADDPMVVRIVRELLTEAA